MSLPKMKAKYLVRAVACSLGVSKNGNEQIGVSVQVVEHAELDGEEITWIGHFTEKTQDRTIESLQHFGWTGDNLEELVDLDADACARLLPNVVEIVTDVEEYEGEMQLKVKWVNAPGGGRFAFKDKLEGAALKGFAARMKGAIRNARGGQRPANGAPPKQPTHPNAPSYRRDDDIPF